LKRQPNQNFSENKRKDGQVQMTTAATAQAEGSFAFMFAEIQFPIQSQARLSLS